MRPVSVTVLSSLPPQRGVSPYTSHLLQALAGKDEVDLDAIAFRTLYPSWLYPGGSPDADEDQAPAVRVRRLISWWNPLTWIHAGLSPCGDVVHAQWWNWFLAPAYVTALCLMRLRGKRVVVTVHNARPHEPGRWKIWLNALVTRFAHQLIVHSQSNAQQLVSTGADPARINVVPHGILSASSAGAPMQGREDARGALGVPDGARVVLCFGNIRAYKGVDVLLEAVAIARASVPEMRVIVAGEVWKGCADPSATAQRLRVDDIVDCRLGFVAERDVATLYGAADVVVLPYKHFDGQSGAGTLALAAGRAMIVTDVGGLPDLVLDRRAVVRPRDAASLAGTLERVLLDDAWRSSLERDAAQVRADLSWESIADATLRVYERALGVPLRAEEAVSA